MLKKYSERLTKKELLDQIVKQKDVSRAEAEKIARREIPLESFYQTKILKMLRVKYPAAFSCKIHQGAYSRAGVPDVLLIMGGHYFGFEVKRPIFGETSPIQKQTIEKIRKAGGTAAVVTWPEEVEQIIEDWRRRQ